MLGRSVVGVNMKPLLQSQFKAKIINDLGMVLKGKRFVRIVELECSKCSEPFSGTSCNLKSRELCNSCSRDEANKKLLIPLDPSSYKMKLVEDLGMIKKQRWAKFLCPKCTTIFATRAFAPGTQNQQSCKSCWKAGTRGTKHPLYRVWNSIRQRCYNPKRKDYNHYGKLGVSMCDQWKDNPLAFIHWCEINGWKPGLVIDKDIKSNQLGINPHIYSPDTVSFVTAKVNAMESNGKTVIKCSELGEQLEVFPTGTLAAEYVGISKSFMHELCREERSYKGFIYKYSEKPL